MRRYYSARNNPNSLTLTDLYQKLMHLFYYYRDQDYFKEKASITKDDLPEVITSKAVLALGFHLFPISDWNHAHITEDHIFDSLEFLYDHVSKPYGWERYQTETDFWYSDYEGYDEVNGKNEFREQANLFLTDYKSGYELTETGIILALAEGGIQNIINAEIVPYDEVNVDNKIRDAILKWRNRHIDFSIRKQAIHELADVFEWLKKTGKLDKALNSKDESTLFEIINNFNIRHHNPQQKRNYDEKIWHQWMFHFYLATYHAVIRILKRQE
jgi:hypothetical protein